MKPFHENCELKELNSSVVVKKHCFAIKRGFLQIRRKDDDAKCNFLVKGVLEA